MRSVVDADSISAKLAGQWPPFEYPVHIQVAGGVADGGISVRVWNSRGISESAVAYPADHVGMQDPIVVAIVEEIESIVNSLLTEGKLLKNRD